MTDDAFPRSSRPLPPHGQDAADRRDPASDPLMELARLIGQSDPFGAPPARRTDAPRAPDLPTRGPMARPPSRDISPRAERYEEPPPADDYEEPADEPRPARGHPFPWLQVPRAAPAESREASEPAYREPAHREPALREPTFREPAPSEAAYREPPYAEQPYSAPAQPHQSYGQPAHPHDAYDRHEPTFDDRGQAGQHGGYAAGAYPTVPDQHHSPGQYAGDQYAAEPERASGPEDHYPRLDDRQHYPAYAEDGHDQHAHGEHGHGEHRGHDPRYATSEHDEDGEYDPRYAEEGAHGEHDPRYAAAAEEDQYDDEYEYEDDEDGYADEEPKRRNLLKIALAGGLGLVVLGTAGAFGYRAMFHGGSDGPPPLIRADNSPTKVMPTTTADAGAKPINERLASAERMVSREEQPIDLRDPRNASGAVVAPVGTGGVAPYPTAPSATSAAPGSGPAPTEPKRVRTVTIHSDTGTQPAPNANAAPAMPVTVPAATAPARPPAAPRAAAPPAATGNTPLALTPQSAPPTVAAVDTTHPAPAKTAPAGGGGWIVQISAHGTESEAQAAFRAAQAKYSALADYQPLIRRKDLGERGVVYAAQVGPFPQFQDANKLCETLKAAGSKCFPQKF
jgi:sporulation related protein